MLAKLIDGALSYAPKKCTLTADWYITRRMIC